MEHKIWQDPVIKIPVRPVEMTAQPPDEAKQDDSKRESISLTDAFFNPRASAAFVANLEAHDKLKEEIAQIPKSSSAYGTHGAAFLEFLFMGIACGAPSSIIVYLFSDIGWGIRTYTSLVVHEQNGQNLLALGFLLFFILYIFDWSRFPKTLKMFTGVLVCYILFVAGFLKAKTQPQVSVIIVLFHVPILLGLLRLTLSRTTYKYHYYMGITFCTFLCSLCCITLWIMWIYGLLTENDNQWSWDTKQRLIKDSQEIYAEWDLVHERDCGLDREIEDENGKPIDKDVLLKRAQACAAVQTTWYLVWISPLICCGCNMIIGLFCYMRGKYIETKQTSKVESAVKITMIFFAMLVMGMWIAASIAGASMQLAGTLSAFIFGAGVAVFIWLYFEVGSANLLEASKSSYLVRTMTEAAQSDWARALFICFANIFIPMFMVVNVFNQCVRRMRGWPSSGSIFTERFARAMDNMALWNWAGIFTKVNILCIVYFVLMVGVAKATYIFLSWLNEQLQKVNEILVIIIFYAIGFLMFMLPPVPGVPVYITGGIILSARMASTSIGFWGGTIIALATGYSLKLSAVAGQWSIGKQLGKSVKIQKMVGVDTRGIRAIEDILKVPGFSIPKISVLVGGPDWPTSVLCGILNLKCHKCVLGTMPCIFIAAPCVLVGAFLLKAGEEAAEGRGGTWGAVAGTTLFVATLGQSGAMMIAAYYMSEVMGKKREELEKPRPEHAEVEKQREAEVEINKAYDEVTKWKDGMPSHMKFLISLATFAMLFSTGLLVVFDVSCFRPFSLTSKIGAPIHEGGLGNDVMNIFLDLGKLACALFALACILFKCWINWANSAAKKRVDKVKPSESES